MSQDLINYPQHYVGQSVVIEPIVYYEKLPFCLGNALKYVFRAGHKDGSSELQDLKKAQWYLHRYLTSIGPFADEDKDQQEFFEFAKRTLTFSQSKLLYFVAVSAENFTSMWELLAKYVGERISELEPEGGEE
ncbi:DUF3310 domain-containing protein [Turicimonas muris]|uniref:DUF3310 domain-containing protein n=1 Tax=Turicimonas muris TaxID=1796652 RepID=UPI0023F3124A|nr:DUF3310 domain-containing protein [Turicimonas muris]